MKPSGVTAAVLRLALLSQPWLFEAWAGRTTSKVEAMLETWGLRASGSSLKDPTKVSTGGHAGADDELAKMLYVQGVEGFAVAEPLLAHVYAHGQPLESYRYRGFRTRKVVREQWSIFPVKARPFSVNVYGEDCEPESQLTAAIRHEQGSLVIKASLTGEKISDAALAWILLDQFKGRLAQRLIDEPFVLPGKQEERSAEQCAAEGESEGEKKFPNRFHRGRDFSRKPLRSQRQAQIDKKARKTG